MKIADKTKKRITKFKNVIKEILDESGGIDILVNNAGITRDGLIFKMSSENWQQVKY